MQTRNAVIVDCVSLKRGVYGVVAVHRSLIPLLPCVNACAYFMNAIQHYFHRIRFLLNTSFAKMNLRYVRCSQENNNNNEKKRCREKD